MMTQVVDKKRMPWTQLRLSDPDDLVDSNFRPLLMAEKQCNARAGSESLTLIDLFSINLHDS
jgi:hypothetical protein